MTQELDNLRDLREVVEGIPSEDFNINEWGRRKQAGGCGTVGCAIGWYLMTYPDRLSCAWVPDDNADGEEVLAVYGGAFARAAHFGLSGEEHDWLFHSDAGYSILPVEEQKQEFLRRFDKIIDRKEKEHEHQISN